jgi:RNA polymerase primary sigma factor
MDDLIKEGNVGLVRAAIRFDPAHGSRFISYAAWWIRHAMLHAIQEHRLSDLRINEQN